MEKEPLSFSTYSVVIVVILLFFWQCKPESDSRTKEIKEYLKSHYDVKPDEKIDRVYVINDMGCGNCILSLSEFIKQYVNDDGALVIINSRGMNVDIDAFEAKKKSNPNIIIKHQVINDENDPFYHSGVVYLNEEKVDTIVNLTGDDLNIPLQYVFSRERQHSEKPIN